MEKTAKKDQLASLKEAFRGLRYSATKEKDYFVENLSMLVASGMPMLSAISAIREEMESPTMQKSLDLLRDEIEGGTPLWRALGKTGLFKEHVLSLIRVGEESGKLSQNLKLIAIQEQKERDLRSKILGAVLYPVLVLSLTVVIGVSIAWFILPRLAGVFSQLNLKLPFITKVLIATGQFLGAYGIFVLPLAFFIFALLFFFVFFFKKTKFIGQAFVFSLPGLHQLYEEVELARFGYLLGTLLNAGLPATESLDSLEKATDFLHYKRLYAYMRDSVEEGNSIQRSFTLYPHTKRLIPTPIQRLVAAGEQSGNLSEVLLKISDLYEAKTENTAKNLTVLLEPLMLVIVWGGVVSVALAVILPIYNLLGGLNPAPITEETPTTQAAPAATQAGITTPIVQAPVEKKLKILASDTGYVNVRTGPGVDFKKVGTVHPGETYKYNQEDSGWYEITLTDTSVGWISAKYAEIFSTP